MRRLIYYECRKHFFTPVMLWMMLAFLAFNGIKIYSVYLENSIFSSKNQPEFLEVYEQFYKEYKGEITSEKIQKLLSIYKPIKKKTDSGLVGTGADKNSYTYNLYSDELLLRFCFLDKLKYNHFYKAYANNIVKQAKENMSFYKKVGNQYEYKKNYQIAKAFYHRELGEFYNYDRYQQLLAYDFSSIFLILLFIYGCSSVFVKEEETEMKYLIATSCRGGRDTFLAKIVSTLLFVVAAGGIFAIFNGFFFQIWYGIGDAGNQPLYVIKAFQNTDLSLSLKESYFLFSGIRILGFFLLGTLFLCVSLFVKKTIPAFIINFSIVFGLIRYGEHSEENLKLCSPISLICNQELFKSTGFIQIGNYPVKIWIFSICTAGVIAVILLLLCWKHWEKRCR